ncbi:unnamed protein product [Gordionus sp. m RMFG-2023]|uniref:7-dehydrocholesterol reductase-like n=1 Tax=Gordionus sp. m RMFG-2023 TaxID=3053472 RepID=UPI0030E0BE22
MLRQPLLDDHLGDGSPQDAGKKYSQNKSNHDLSKPNLTWGRHFKSKNKTEKYITLTTTLMILIFCPLLVVYYWTSCANFNCSIISPTLMLSKYGPRYFYHKYCPHFDALSFSVIIGWYIFQALLYAFLPGKLTTSQLTPAGNLLTYKINGLLAWTISHLLFFGLYYFNPTMFSLTFISDHWGGLLVGSNILAYSISLLVFLKAHVNPSHPEDRKFSESTPYDFYMGIELNPRIGKTFDLKLFHNGRPGIVAWTMINVSFAAYQHRKFGSVSDSMIIVTLLQGIYALDLFFNEDWYLRTLDIAHDHFGFYLAWGDLVWLPFMYTVQGYYLSRTFVHLGPYKFWALLVIGLVGYGIFRTANNQKDGFRQSLKAKNKSMGYRVSYFGVFRSKKPASMIVANYLTADGKKHTSALLFSGFWGLARHFNYTGDLLLATCMCLACGSMTKNFYPYFYLIFMFTLLINRIYRDEEKCKSKYGKYWDQYCEIVPYRLIPYVF